VGPDIPRRLRSAGLWALEDHVLVSRAVGDPRWALVGGGLEPGESASEACQREFREEVGIDVRCERLAIVGDIIIRPNGRLAHDVCLYFIVTAVREVRARTSVASRETGLEVGWISLSQLGDAPLVPASLNDLIPRALASEKALYATYDCRLNPDERAGTSIWP